jgi:hypothetical protein
MITERALLIGTFAVTLVAATMSTWTSTRPRLEETASAATRRAPPAQRAEVADRPQVSASPPVAPVEPTTPPARAVRARARPPETEPAVTLVVPDLPEPPARSPLLWDDLFPPPPPPPSGTLAPAAAPCFDKLQGIEGLSPCPLVTPRAPAR